MIFQGLATYDFEKPSGFLVFLFPANDAGSKQAKAVANWLAKFNLPADQVDGRSVPIGFLPYVNLTDGRRVNVRRLVDGSEIAVSIGVVDDGELRAMIENAPGLEMPWQNRPFNPASFGNKVQVLGSQGWIELLGVMGDDLTIVQAARVSYLNDSKGAAADRRLLRYLWNNRHTSPFEQVEFRFRVRAPVVTWWQWVRHRTWNFNAQSGRYTPFKEGDFYIPQDWRRQSTENHQGSDGLIDRAKANRFTALLDQHCEDSYTMYKAALQEGVAKEQARLFLPAWGSYYTWVCKVDAHNLMHFLRLRMASEAQEEIRVYAAAIYEHFFKPVLPWTAEVFEESLR